MSASDVQWLDLREAADARARNGAVAEALRNWFLQRAELSVVDLKCGTGANVRAMAALLAERQRWRLVDKDADMLAAARAQLSSWADSAEDAGGWLVLRKQNRQIAVSFVQADLSSELERALAVADDFKPDLLTASALFDATSEAFMSRFADAAERSRAAVYVTLTANGQLDWKPRHPTDRELLAAYHRAQMRDRGFGPAAGPTAAVALSEALSAQGFSVTEGASPWRLGAADKALVDELARRFARAVAETKSFAQKDADAWLTRAKSGVEAGHVDLFATPPMGRGVAMDGED